VDQVRTQNQTRRGTKGARSKDRQKGARKQISEQEAPRSEESNRLAPVRPRSKGRKSHPQRRTIGTEKQSENENKEQRLPQRVQGKKKLAVKIRRGKDKERTTKENESASERFRGAKKGPKTKRNLWARKREINLPSKEGALERKIA